MGGVASRLAGCWRRSRRLAEDNEELPELEREEVALKGTVQDLKGELEQASKANKVKLEEIRELTRRLHELKYGKGMKIIKRKGTGSLSASVQVAEEAGMQSPDEVFPEEVWRMIIGHVSDPKDLWNLCNTCQLFDNILSKWKTGWLLEQALPYLYQHLPGKKLLECRMVSRSWKGAVDKFLGDHISTRPHDPDKVDPRRLDFVNPVKEKVLRDRDNTLGYYSTTCYLREEEPPKPFIGRFVDMFLEARDEGDYEGFLNDACKYLTRFEKDVWYLEISLPGPGTIADEAAHSRFIQFVTVDLLPNLRRLDLDYIHATNVGFGNPPEIDLGSIPDALQLDTILGHDINHEDALLEALLNRFHLQLRKLSLTVRTWHRLRHLDWNNLTELHLSLVVDLENLDGLQGIRIPHLSKLRLNLNRLNDDRITFHNLSESIRKLCQTTVLNTVRLDGGLHRLGMVQVVGNGDVMPAIKTLEIDHKWGAHVPCYTFLLSCFPLTENLHLFVRRTDNDYCYGPEIDLLPQEKCKRLARKIGFQEVVEIVEVNKYVYQRQMYRSNIWELLPRLKVFSFQWDVYTRHGYEEYSEKMETR